MKKNPFKCYPIVPSGKSQAKVASCREMWWLHPIALVVVVELLVVVSLLQSADDYNSLYKSTKWVGLYYFMLATMVLMLLSAGIYFGKKSTGTYAGRKCFFENRNFLFPAFIVTAFICLGAYSILIANFVSIHGAKSLLTVFKPGELSANMYVFRNASGRISGITTFNVAEVVAASLGGLILARKNSARIEMQIVRVLLGAIVIFAALDSLLFSERLALILVVAPFAVARYGFSSRKPKRWESWLPVVAVVALIVLFAVAEYPRTGLKRYGSDFGGYFNYVVARLLGYYSNAINTEAMFIEFGDTAWLPYWSMMWVWQLPGIDYSSFSGHDIAAQANALLGMHANPEFNNPCGILTFYKDFSFLGMPLYFIFGLFIGKIYGSFREGELRGALVYPVIYLTLLELPRYFFLGINIGFMVCIVLVIAWVMLGLWERPTTLVGRIGDV